MQCSDPPRSLQPVQPLSCSSFPQSHTSNHSDLIFMDRLLMISSSSLFNPTLKLSGRKWKSMSLRLCPAGHWRHQVLSKLSVSPLVVPSRVPGASLLLRLLGPRPRPGVVNPRLVRAFHLTAGHTPAQPCLSLLMLCATCFHARPGLYSL